MRKVTGNPASCSDLVFFFFYEGLTFHAVKTVSAMVLP